MERQPYLTPAQKNAEGVFVLYNELIARRDEYRAKYESPRTSDAEANVWRTRISEVNSLLRLWDEPVDDEEAPGAAG